MPEVASWRTLARNRLERIRDDIQFARKRGVQREEVFDKIERAFGDAETTLGERGPLRGLRNWLTGVDIERVWFRLHETEQLLFLVLEEEAIRARVPGLMAEVALRLPRTDPRASIFAAQLEAIAEPERAKQSPRRPRR